MPFVFPVLWIFIVIWIVWFNVKKVKKNVQRGGGSFTTNVSGAQNLCPKCGKYARADAYTCPHCGADLKKKCKSCGKWVDIKCKTCPICSAPFYDGAASNNDNVQCTYHDTYSAGYDPHCHDSGRDYDMYTRRTNLDDIGLVKGKGRNKIETVEDYERARHRSGAYHINVNDVLSNYETTTPEQYSNKSASQRSSSAKTTYTSNTRKTQSTRTSKSTAKGASGLVGFIVGFIIIFTMVVIVNIAKSSFDDFESSIGSVGERHYAMEDNQNVSEDDFKTNSTIWYYYDYLKKLTKIKDDNYYVFIYYNDTENNDLQCALYRLTESSEATTGFFYYYDDDRCYHADQYITDDTNTISNSFEFVDEDGNTHTKYIQVDLFQVDGQEDEEFNGNFEVALNRNYQGYSYSEVSDPLTLN